MTRHIPIQIENYVENLDFFPECELVFGLTYAVGTDYKPVRNFITRLLESYGYQTRFIRVSELIASLTNSPLDDETEAKRISSSMDAGNRECKAYNRRDLWALAVVGEINRFRGKEQAAQKRVAHVILSLKRPDEVSTLRKVYGPGFFLIGVFATEKERLESLIESDIPKKDALNLIRRDEDERTDPFGQRTSKTFQLADFFVQLRGGVFEKELTRFLSLVFSNPYETPTPHENAMFLAYASSLRSGQLGRQVGAAITSRNGDVIAVGCNDVPRPGGGLYWPGSADRRDHTKLDDSNDSQIDKIVDRLVARIGGCVPQDEIDQVRKDFRTAVDVTEFGRAVHAEMDALLTCARSGVSPMGGILYTTTFPCHNCTRHIIAAGIQRVYYIEPYAKSKAEELHEDAIVVEEKSMKQHRGSRWKLPFTHFVGVGPRRYFDLFSLNLSSGYELRRKIDGHTLQVDKTKSWPRIPLSPLNYLQREREIIEEFLRLSLKSTGQSSS